MNSLTPNIKVCLANSWSKAVQSNFNLNEGHDGMHKGIASGMQGVFLVAAELTFQGLIVSVTSRNAFGADLLATTTDCSRAWSIQVKTNSTPTNYWLVGAHAQTLVSESHVYVFVNLKGNQRPEFLVVPSAVVAGNVWIDQSKSGPIYSFDRGSVAHPTEGWEIFKFRAAPSI